MRWPGRPGVNQREARASSSGCVLRQERRAKKQRWRAACLSRSVRAGSVRPAGWRPISLGCALGTLPVICEREELALLKAQRLDGSRDRSTDGGDRHRRFRVSCVVMLRPAAVCCTIEPRLRNGRRNAWPRDRRQPSLPRTRGWESTYKIDSPALSLMREASVSRDRMCNGRVDAMVAALTDGGASDGAPADETPITDRLPHDDLCGSLTTLFTGQSMFWVDVHCDASYLLVYVPAERCECRSPGRGSAASRSSLPR